MREAAAKLSVSHLQIRRLIKAAILATEQVVPDAPYRIRASDLQDERVTWALTRKGRHHRSVRSKGLSGTILGKIVTRHARSLINIGTLAASRTARRSAGERDVQSHTDAG